MPSLMKKIRKKLRKLSSTTSNKQDGSKSPSSVTSKGSAPGLEPGKIVARNAVATSTVPKSSSNAEPKQSIVAPPNVEKKSAHLASPTGLKEGAAAVTKVASKNIVEINDETFVDSSFVVIHRHNNAKEETKEEVATISYSVKEFSPAAVPAGDNASVIPAASTGRRWPLAWIVVLIIATMVVATSVVVVKDHHHIESVMESFRSMLPASWTSTEPAKWNLWPSNDLPIAMEPSPAVPHNGNIPTASEPIWKMLANPTAFDTRQVAEPPSLTTLIESLEPYVSLWQQEDREEPQSSYFTTVTKTVESYWTTIKDAVGQQPQVKSSLKALEPYWTSMMEDWQSALEYVGLPFKEEQQQPPAKTTIQTLEPYLTAFGVGSVSGLAWLALGSFWN